MHIVLALLLGTIITLIGCAEGAVAKEAAKKKINDFFGSYVEKSDTDIAKDVIAGDASVVIKPSGKAGFNVSWKTVFQRTSRKPSIRSYSITYYSITFYPVPKRAGLYGAAMKRNVFGHMAPLDPLSGDPYVWASLREKTLTVWALFTIDDGGYEIQIHKRTLAQGRLHQRFERVRNGKTMKLITTTLKKTYNEGPTSGPAAKKRP